MNADPRNAPRDRGRLPHRGLALALAIAVHLAFLAVLIFSIRWQNRAPEPVTAELYAPIAQQPKSAPPPPLRPTPKVEPAPTPPQPEPAPPPKPLPAPPPKPVVEPEKPDVRDAEIALKARRDEERKKRVEAEQRAQAEQQKRVADLQRQRELQKQQDEKKRADEKKAADEKKIADARERQQREMTQMREQVEKEMQARANAETAARAQAARKTAESDWISRVQAKVKGNVILPPDLSGNPEAQFDVVQLPTGEIIDVKLRKSSGVRSYDDAVQRAILKSSPLPKPDRAEMFQRELLLRFRPND